MANPYDQFDAAANPYDQFDKQDAPVTAAPTGPKSRPIKGRLSSFISGNLNKGIASTVDAFLNAPNQVLNLGKAAVGTAADVAGHPEYAPDLTPDPNLARRGMEKAGLITPASEATTTPQKIAAGALQIAGGMSVPMGKGKAPGAFTEIRDSATAAAAERKAQAATFDKALQDGRKAGYVVPPSQVSSSLTGNAVEGLVARTTPTERVASVRNSHVTNRLVKRDLGLSTKQPVTDATFDNLRKDAGQAYDAVKKSGVPIKADEAFKSALEKIKSSDYGQAASEYGDVLGNEKVDNLVKGINKEEVSPTAAVEMVKELRRRATKNLKAWDDLEKQDLGQAQRKAAQALEDLIERNLSSAGKSNLVKAWKEARVSIAKTYDAEAAWDGQNFSAKQLAKLEDKGSPLTGGMAQAAQFARHFPKAAQDVTNMAQKSGFSQYDLWGGVVGSIATGHPYAIGLAAVPWATQRALLSGLGQKMFASTPNYDVGLGLRTMAQLDPMFQRALVQGGIQEGQE